MIVSAMRMTLDRIANLKRGSQAILGIMIAIGTPFIMLTPLAACSRAEDHPSRGKAPLTGDLQLEYLGKSDSRLRLKLSSRAFQEVTFRGARNPSGIAIPWDTQIECKSLDSEYWDREPVPLIDGVAANVRISPGETVLLEVDGAYADLYKDSRCHVKLRLEDTFIQSNDFEP